MRRALVTAQVALSLVLLVGALLFVRSLQKLLDVQPGFRPEGIVALNIDIGPAKYPKERRPVVYTDLLEKLRAQPGVVSAAEVAMAPISGSGWNEGVRPDAFTGEQKNAFFNRYGPGYLKTMGTPLLAVMGTALGVALAQVLTRALIAFLSTEDNPVFVGLAPNRRGTRIVIL